MPSFLFLTGADMDPTEVRQNHPTAQFVARGFAHVHAGEISSHYAKVIAGSGSAEVWGILLQVPEEIEGDQKRHMVTTDDGRNIEAVIVGDRMIDGFTQAALAAAQYWELPPGYVGRMKMATHELGAVSKSEG